MIDLHTHSTASDGTDSPFALVNKALSSGITMLGITDHDTTSGWAEAITAARKPISLVLGAEISTLTLVGISVHMLGLLFDGENEQIQNMLSEARDTRIPRMKKMIELLHADGYAITMEDVIMATPAGATIGRPHLADALVSNGVVKSRDEAFENLLHNESKYYVTHATPTPEFAIQTIAAAGGVSIIAHPMASQRGAVISNSMFSALVDAGLNGIEVDHRDQTAAERVELRKVAEELDLVITGASDYHGTGKMNSLGENLTDPAQWERLESLASHRRVVKP
jgi:predicted metal-dependent phosphoesterase TrpH